MVDDEKLIPAKPEHGAQVHLTGAARAAARGALHDNIADNTAAKTREEMEGRAAPGTTPDGSTVDGKLAPDVMHGSDQANLGPAGHGEGVKGFRPGDDKIAQAEHDAAAERAAARDGSAPREG